ncbi:hypothetical protein DWQ65_03120 [Treponema phagedenis]|uniref:hypothetical protein n=1 Tax=Treponema phagedenis TaxID=162 RepID=UPI0001F63A72|nr:hypothetical protein [Treponema phagedenis]EFW38992.1 hypothetical protein HMPREF9554_00515 [Treponema phagedenis F0421]QSH99084.1 hypothetical protein DWQ65_03120 [Treponema phagedenis]TYT76438.1 hypothetical protein FS559_15670 [Treponema phagedenis]TYT76548.1 hypothetical protein FS559_13870 [Treponema phagedenis]TYT76857.1 hypothetical protein FS559_13205 [Treponema phagedenis]
MKRILYLLFIGAFLFGCSGLISNTGTSNSGGTQPGKLETVGFVTKQFFENNDYKCHKKINTYAITFDGEPGFDEIGWFGSDDNPYVAFENFNFYDTSLPEDFICWTVLLHPRAPKYNKGITWLAKNMYSTNSDDTLEVSITNVEVLENKYFDPVTGQPFKLKVSFDGYPDIIIAGTKK